MLGFGATTTFTMTLASLAAASSRESSTISALVGGTSYDDYQIRIALGSSQSTTASDRACYIWFSGSADGTAFDSPATGADAAITIGTAHNLKGPFFVSIPAGAVTYNISVPSVSYYFNGILPEKFNIIVENQTNGALSATEFTKYITPVYFTT